MAFPWYRDVLLVRGYFSTAWRLLVHNSDLHILSDTSMGNY